MFGGDGRARLWRAVVIATAVAGTLDILWAFAFAGFGGIGPGDVLRFIASGPFGDAARHGGGWPAVGLLVHFAIIACMATAFTLIARRVPSLLRHPAVTGLAYGLLLWLIMHWLVLPLRWPVAPLPHTLLEIAAALFAHCMLVGLPIAMIARRFSEGATR